MDAQIFWNIIGNYNEQTIIVQICLFETVKVFL